MHLLIYVSYFNLVFYIYKGSIFSGVISPHVYPQHVFHFIHVLHVFLWHVCKLNIGKEEIGEMEEWKEGREGGKNL